MQVDNNTVCSLYELAMQVEFLSRYSTIAEDAVSEKITEGNTSCLTYIYHGTSWYLPRNYGHLREVAFGEREK